MGTEVVDEIDGGVVEKLKRPGYDK